MLDKFKWIVGIKYFDPQAPHRDLFDRVEVEAKDAFGALVAFARLLRAGKWFRSTRNHKEIRNGVLD